MKALTKTMETYRQHEQDYISELVSIRKEVKFLLNFISKSPKYRSLTPAIGDLRERELLIEKALQESELPPLPDELRNPFTRPRTPDETEYIRELIKKCDGRRIKSEPTE